METKISLPPIVVTAEMAIEELMIREISQFIPVDSAELERGRYSEWDIAHSMIDQLHDARPIIFIGHSLERDSRRPRPSVENVRACWTFLRTSMDCRLWFV